MNDYTEDELVQQTTADYLRNVLGWRSVYAYNRETFGQEGTSGRRDDREVVPTRYLQEALVLVRLNPGLPDDVYRNAVERISENVGVRKLTPTDYGTGRPETNSRTAAPG